MTNSVHIHLKCLTLPIKNIASYQKIALHFVLFLAFLIDPQRRLPSFVILWFYLKVLWFFFSFLLFFSVFCIDIPFFLD